MEMAPPAPRDQEHEDARAAFKSMRVDAPTSTQKVGRITVSCLILNRTIGSGVFVATRLMLLATRSAGITVLLWVGGGLVMLCALVVWNEFGLTIPRYRLEDGEKVEAPMSGGEKNYIEYLLRGVRFLGTCLFGIPFLALGNLSGNAVTFGTYFLVMIGHDDPPRWLNIVVAISITTLSCFVHFFTRNGGIWLSNGLAFVKVTILLGFIVVLPIISAKEGHNYSSNLSIPNAFDGASPYVSDYAYSLLYVLYAFSGYEQPFYILSETKRPRKIFPTTTLYTMVLTVALFVAINVVYICTCPMDPEKLLHSTDMVSLMLENIYGPETAPRIVAGLISLSITGNIVVMTFTAARVKQEIAKEGILPFWKFFAGAVTSPTARISEYFSNRKHKREATQVNKHLEQVPAGGLLLHWIMSLVVIGATSTLSAQQAFTALVFLYAYVLIAVVGFGVAGGLVCLYWLPCSKWGEEPHSFKPKGGPMAALTYASVLLFIIIAVFFPPSPQSPFGPSQTQISSNLLPSLGLSSVFWGFVYWLGLHAWEWVTDRPWHVKRVAYIEENDDGEWVQQYEVITASRPEKQVLRDHKIRRQANGSVGTVSHRDLDAIVLRRATVGTGTGIGLDEIYPEDDRPRDRLGLRGIH